jgi:hypothetical protein
LEIQGGEFGNLRIPTYYQTYYRNIYSKLVPGTKTQMQPLHQARKHDRAFMLTLTKASCEPISIRPLTFPENTKQKVQYLLTDAEGMLGFLKTLPQYKNLILPCLMAQAKDPNVSRSSSYSTFTTSSQVRGGCTLRQFPASKTALDMSIVQFPKSYSIHLGYSTDGSPGYGIYFPSDLSDWLMEERDVMVEAVRRMIAGNPQWNCIDTSEYKLVKDEDGLPPPVPMTPWQTPAQHDPFREDETDYCDGLEIEGGNGGKKRVRLMPANTAGNNNMSKEAIGRELDEILGDARMSL